MVGVGPMEMLIVLFASGFLGLPLSVTPLPPDPIVLQAAPEESLVYVGWAGQAKPDPTSKNRTELLLAEQEVQTFIDQISSQVVGLVRKKAQDNPATQMLADALPGLLHSLVTHPTAFYVTLVKGGVV